MVCLALDLAGGAWFQCRYGGDELLLLNVPWSQEFSDVLRILT